MDLSQQQGFLLASIARIPEAPEDWHKDYTGASQLSNNIYKLMEYGYIIKNPNSGVAKRNHEYFEYQPKPSRVFREDDLKTVGLEKDIITTLESLGGEVESLRDLASEVEDSYQNVRNRVAELEQRGKLSTQKRGRELSVSLEDTDLEEEPDYDIYMITGKGVHALKEFIEDQPPIIQESFFKHYRQRYVYAPKHCLEKV